jgi:class 3 adenylate cyclase
MSRRERDRERDRERQREHQRQMVRDRLSEKINALVELQLIGEVERETKQLPEGTITLVFTDVEGSTALVRDLGDEPARAILRRHDALVREGIEAHGGTEVERTGDSFMVAFRTARKALEAALDLRDRVGDAGSPDRPLRIRIGIDTGEVIAEDQGYFGTTVFRASRIVDLARGGQILVSESTRVLGGQGGFHFAPIGEVELKGLAGRHALYELAAAPKELPAPKKQLPAPKTELPGS